MKAIKKLDFLLQTRIQFLHQLFIMNAYQQLLNINLDSIKNRHFEMVKQEAEWVECILRITRIEQTFKKQQIDNTRQFHKLILAVFNKIEPGISLHLEPSGTYKQIIDDYIKFFNELKQKDILNLLNQIFDPQVYSQTTVIYVLLQLLFKFLRIKCEKLICNRIQPKLQKNKEKQYTLHFRTIDKNLEAKQHGKKISKIKLRNYSAPANSYSSRYKSELRNNGSNKMMQFNCLTINQHSSIDFLDKSSQLKQRCCNSKSARKNSFQSSYEINEKPKRKVIRSFREIKESTQKKIKKNLQQLIKESQASSKYFTNHTKFIVTHKREWKQYLNLIGIQDIIDTDDNQNIKTADLHSEAKKKEWEEKNNGKIVSESCCRNQEIRKYIDMYNEEYNDKYRNQVFFNDRLTQ